MWLDIKGYIQESGFFYDKKKEKSKKKYNMWKEDILFNFNNDLIKQQDNWRITTRKQSLWPLIQPHVNNQII